MDMDILLASCSSSREQSMIGAAAVLVATSSLSRLLSPSTHTSANDDKAHGIARF